MDNPPTTSTSSSDGSPKGGTLDEVDTAVLEALTVRVTELLIEARELRPAVDALRGTVVTPEEIDARRAYLQLQMVGGIMTAMWVHDVHMRQCHDRPTHSGGRNFVCNAVFPVEVHNPHQQDATAGLVTGWVMWPLVFSAMVIRVRRKRTHARSVRVTFDRRIRPRSPQ